MLAHVVRPRPILGVWMLALLGLLSGLCKAEEPGPALYKNLYWKETPLLPNSAAQRGWITVRSGLIDEVGLGDPPSVNQGLTQGLTEIDMQGLIVDPGRVCSHSELLKEGLEALQ